MTKFDPTKPVQTRKGDSVEILMHEGLCTKYGTTIVAVVTDSQDFQHVRTFCSDGQVAKSAQTPDDLINIPEEPITIQQWGVVSDGVVVAVYGDAEKAQRVAGRYRELAEVVHLTGTLAPWRGQDDD